MLGSLFLGPTQAVGQGFCIWNNLDIHRKKKWHPHVFVISCTHPILGPSWANDLLVFLHTSILYSTVTCWNLFSIFDVSNIMFAVSPNLSPIQSVPFLIANPHCYWLNPHCPWLLYWKDPNYGVPWVLKSCSNRWHAQMPAAKCASTQVVVVVD